MASYFVRCITMATLRVGDWISSKVHGTLDSSLLGSTKESLDSPMDEPILWPSASLRFDLRWPISDEISHLLPGQAIQGV
ncbi:hypothetical protein ACIGHF_08955 [Stenotrophomonas sp. NPDC077464]|jgi:hypothetical protein|uniref:hypothetical protein n=1 Tax=unclassified Stenotrophomonas TaxID=196198 RepID=UPI0037D40F1F